MSSVRERLGPYEILAPLGAGGMGEVYVARDPVLGRKVAIKLLPIKFSTDRESLSRFTQEARSASALNHPNIVTIHEVGMDGGMPYIVMEYVEGRDLRTMIQEGPLPNRKTLEIATQIADGLAAAHEQGIVHRDLKPENIMLTKDGFVKILDFGLAKVMKPADESDRTVELDLPATNPGTILGTVGYMSPEQASGKRIDFRSDQFALGAILYELATGKSAFEGETAIDTLSAILHADPEPLTHFNAKAPAPFRWIVERLLAKDPEERYASPRDLARELRTVRDRIASEVASMEMPRPPLLRPKHWPIVIGAVVLVLATAGGIAWMVQRRSPVSGPAAARPASAKNYLAVMRFKDLSGDPNGQVVVDGLAETLTARLAHFPAVQIMRANTPETLTGTNAQQVARDLGANLVLTGSMQRAGDRLRVAYRLIDTDRGSELPGDVVDGSMSDLFGIQDKLADSVANTLHLGTPRVKPSPLDTAISQREYLEALGYLRRYDVESSVDQAIRILEDLGSQSGSASIQASLGRAYLNKFQLTHDPKWAAPATAACERAVLADPQNPEVHVTLGELRRLTGRLPEAVNEYRQALTQQPNSADALLGLAETYKAAGKLREAEQAYRKSIELQPNFWGGYNKLGVFFLTNGRYPESAEMFKRVVELVPDNQRGYNNLGSAYLLLGNYDEAASVFATSIAKKASAQGYSNLGTCYYFQGRYSDAANAFEQATSLEPTYYSHWANLGDTYRLIPDGRPRANAAYDRAIQLARQELRVNPHESMVQGRLAVCLARRGQAAEALKTITAALELDPKSPGSQYRAALVAAATRNDRAAQEWLAKAIAAGYSRAEAEREPDFANLRNTDFFRQLMKRPATIPSRS